MCRTLSELASRLRGRRPESDGSGSATASRPGAPWWTGLVLACCVLLGAGAIAGSPFAGAAYAGDNAAIFYFEPGETEAEEIEADPGETVDLDVVVSSHGSLRGYGLSEISFDVSYDPEIVADASVEHAEWLAEGGDEDAELDGSATVDEAAGLISVEQAREPAGDGVTGSGAVATISLTIAEDADPTNLELAFESGSAILSTGDPQTVWGQEATVSVDGGVDEGNDVLDDIDGVTLSDDADLTGADGGDAEDAEDDTAVSLPGFGVPAAAVAVLVAGLALRVVRRSGVASI